jgi:hypothetical protein
MIRLALAFLLIVPKAIYWTVRELVTVYSYEQELRRILEPDAVLCDAGNEAAPPLSDAPLPDAFQRWMDGRHD